MNFVGVITALVTPFKEDYSLDLEALRENVRFQIENGVHGLVPLGTTGESPTIKEEERKLIIKTVVDEVNGKIPVIVGTGTYSTEEAVRLSKEAQDLGADGLLVVAPYYNKPTQEGLYLHFKAISEAVDLPIIVYNIPGRTGVNVEVQTLVRLSQFDNIVAVKEASGNLAQVMDIIEALGDRITVLSGDDNLTLPIMALGGKGVISVISNLLPKPMVEFVEAALKGDFKKAKELHYHLLPLFKAAFIETNPIPIKTMMNLVGMKAGPCRLPLCNMQPHNLEKVKKILSRYENYFKLK
ncbi:MAG: 4-hydroxy-tetrahydrodipicolinate synthase [Thermoproteota archaeon]|nr:4-hydroxy-tetrahydrodipicolinate synthase [Thermoproteota archaeon]